MHAGQSPASVAGDVEAIQQDARLYWGQRWTAGQTGWQRAEAEAPRFALNVEAAFDLAATEHQRAVTTQGADTQAAAAALLIDRRSVAGKWVFIPLCGDTPALRFFFDAGAHVVGVDCVMEPLATAMSRLATTCGTTEGSNAVTPDVVAGGIQRLTLRRPGGGSVSLFCGDIFDWCERVAPMLQASGELERFAIWYDRGSFVAIPPSTRARYVASVTPLIETEKPLFTSTMTGSVNPTLPRAVAVFVFVVRSEAGRHLGPPFHCPDAEVRQLLERPQGQQEASAAAGPSSVWKLREIHRHALAANEPFGECVWVACR